MEAKELMIDDWVVFHDSGYASDGTVWEKDRVCQIDSIDTDVRVKWYDEDGCEEEWPNVSVMHLSPIPLTSEILEENGFERCVSSIDKTSTSSIPVCKSNQFANKEFGGNTRIIDMDIHGFTLTTDVFGTTEKNKVNHIFYVHQLQHALRLCGIKKDIEL